MKKDLIHITPMAPGEYRNGGKELIIDFSFAGTPFGEILIASTNKGICHVAFVDDKDEAIQKLQQEFPNAVFNQEILPLHQKALSIFSSGNAVQELIQLHIKSTPFQLKVWEALLEIPMGKLTTYDEIACRIDNPRACRAVGNAVGKNPVAFLIPCHRVVRSTGALGGYMWGPSRKKAIIEWESATSE